jgi:ABC-type glycerol-3-phosphate transport system permease component
MRGTEYSLYRLRRDFGRLLAHLFLGVLAIVFLFPFYWLLISAFKSKDQIFASPPQFFPSPWRFSNFRDALDAPNTDLLRSFMNSVIITAGHCGLALFLCSLAGYAFAKYPKAPGRDPLFTFVLGTMMIPFAVLVIPLYVIMMKLHAVNTYWAMIIPGAANAFGIFWMRQYITSNVHDDLIDAARIDGCSEFGIYARLVVPIIKPALAALGILTVIFAWNNLMLAFLFMRTKEMYTLPLVIYLLNGETRIPYGIVMAGSLMATLPLVLAFLLFQRYFIEGITAGAIKG